MCRYETCPFCNKLRAYLDWSGIAYRTVEVNPLNKKQLKQNPSPPELAAVKTVPALVINGHVQTESTDIIKNLHRIMTLYQTQSKELDQNEIVRTTGHNTLQHCCSLAFRQSFEPA